MKEKHHSIEHQQHITTMQLYCSLLLFFMLISLFSFGQITKITGKVIDKTTGKGIPFVNIALINTTVGTATDFNGDYFIETRTFSDTLVASCLGYGQQKILIKKNVYQEINFTLEQEGIRLSEVIILPGENPAIALFNKMIEKKKINNPINIDYIQYESYNKIEFDLNNITEKFINSRSLKPFRFVFDNMDTSVINGKGFLPIFLTESISDVYRRRDPRSNKEHIKAVKVSGVKNESISKYLGNLYQQINIYDNHIALFDRSFISPTSKSGLNYYKYYLIDSAFIDNQWCYHLMFKPKRKQEPTFTGHLWIHDTTYSVKEVEMRIVEDANVNYINDFVVRQRFNRIDDKYNVITYDNLIIDFNLFDNTEKVTGMFGRKTSSFRNFTINKELEEAFYNDPINVIVADDARNKDDMFWVNARHDSLTKSEKTIYKMVDTIASMPKFQTYIDVFTLFATGYKVWGNFEIGPYYTFYSYNLIEGNRFRFGGRTSNDFSTKIMPFGHIAYGTKDEKYKYSSGFVYMFNKNPRRSMGASYKYDLEQLGQSVNAFKEDNILYSILKRGPADKLTMVENYKGFYEHEWFPGFSNTFTFSHRSLMPAISEGYEIFENDRTTLLKKINTSEISIRTRYAYEEKFVYGEFERMSLGTKYPIISARYLYGMNDIWDGEFEYHKLFLKLSHWYNIGILGHSRYRIEAGQIWGKLPYPLLKLHEGNETYSYDPLAFNMMNYFEFASDRYLSANYSHHFQGLFFNKIPLFRKLKWREVVHIQGITGTINRKNKEYNPIFQERMSSIERPYFECGAGIENIFTIARVDAMWRLSHLDKEETIKFGIMLSLHLDF